MHLPANHLPDLPHQHLYLLCHYGVPGHRQAGSAYLPFPGAQGHHRCTADAAVLSPHRHQWRSLGFPRRRSCRCSHCIGSAAALSAPPAADALTRSKTPLTLSSFLSRPFGRISQKSPLPQISGGDFLFTGGIAFPADAYH